MKYFKLFLKYVSILLLALTLEYFFDPQANRILNNLYYTHFNPIKTISQLQYDGGTITLTSDGYVTIEAENGTKDSLPVSLVSEELAQKFIDDINLKHKER